MGKAKVVMTSPDVVFNNGFKMKAVVTPCFAHTSHSRQTFPEDPLSIVAIAIRALHIFF